MAELTVGNTSKNRNRRKKTKKPQRVDNYIPTGDPKLLDMPIEELGLRERTLDVLKKGNLSTVKDIIKYRDTELYRIQNFNKKSLIDVSAKIKGLGLNFRPDDKPEEVEQIVDSSRENRIKVFANGRIDDRSKPSNNRKDTRNTNDNKSRQSNQRDKKGIVIREEKLAPDALIKFSSNNKHGFKDIKGRVVIPASYDEVFNFKEDLACVELNGLYGYIDKKNNLVIPCQYELAMSFSEGLACVTIKEKSGYIDKEGKVVFDLKYDAATAFSEGSARVKIDGKWGILDSEGKVRML